nr:unnamed protein product [Spirometra erinaceieuropaei]
MVGGKRTQRKSGSSRGCAYFLGTMVDPALRDERRQDDKDDAGEEEEEEEGVELEEKEEGGEEEDRKDKEGDEYPRGLSKNTV